MVRCVDDRELEQLKQLRLRALLNAPEAFGSSYGNEVGRGAEGWRSWVTEGRTFVVADEEGWYGLPAVVVDRADDLLCHLVCMWIEPSHRRKGLGRVLVATAVVGLDGAAPGSLAWALSMETRPRCGSIDKQASR
jgi:GNAT superfamily N-acetyltransferase